MLRDLNIRIACNWRIVGQCYVLMDCPENLCKANSLKSDISVTLR